MKQFKFLLVICFTISSCNLPTKCYVDKQLYIKQGKSELIDMGGVSTFGYQELHKETFKFSEIDTKAPKIRYSKYSYQNFRLIMMLGSNNDTGNDRLTIMFGEKLIYTLYFGEYEYRELDFMMFDKGFEQIKFVVDNQYTPNNTPGAFQASIHIKKL